MPNVAGAQESKLCPIQLVVKCCSGVREKKLCPVQLMLKKDAISNAFGA